MLKTLSRFLALLGACLAIGLLSVAPASAQSISIEGNQAAAALPVELFPGYTVLSATIDEELLASRHAVSYVADQQDWLNEPFALVLQLMIVGDRPTTGTANFLFSRIVENAFTGFITSFGATDYHFEAYDGPVVARDVRWTKIEYQIADAPGTAYLVAFPYDQGMAFVTLFGFLDLATPEDTAIVGRLLALQLGAA
jgi:hypothetical protein